MDASVQHNLGLWHYSLDHPELAFGDPYYLLAGSIAIPESPDQPNTALVALERAVIDLLDQLMEISDLSSDKAESLLDDLVNALEAPRANHLTFLSFWKQMDMNYSVFTNLTAVEKKAFLHLVVPIYLQKRHAIYRSHGYSAVTLQAALDNAGHKQSGNLANVKLEALCSEFGLQKANSLAQLQDQEFSFCIGKGISKAHMATFKDALGIRFPWSDQYVGKKPDFVLHLRAEEFYIGEAKHKKESGGGQNGQIAELIDLVRQTESRPAFGYISFLDGIQFNQFITMHHLALEATATSAALPNKEMKQYEEITSALETNPGNYFLNTAGFKEFLTQRLNREV